jgi:hypothetical protein
MTLPNEQLLWHPRHSFFPEVVRVRSDLENSFVVKRLTGHKVSILKSWFVRWIFSRESKAISRALVRCPEVMPKIFRITKDEIVMEFIQGSFYSLQSDLKKRPELYFQLEKTLQTLHANGIAHGELRLGHVLVCESKVVLIDFVSSTMGGGFLFRCCRIMDRMALLWIKVNCFDLPMSLEEMKFLRRHFVFHRLFLAVMAPNILFN